MLLYKTNLTNTSPQQLRSAAKSYVSVLYLCLYTSSFTLETQTSQLEVGRYFSDGILEWYFSEASRRASQYRNNLLL